MSFNICLCNWNGRVTSCDTQQSKGNFCVLPWASDKVNKPILLRLPWSPGWVPTEGCFVCCDCLEAVLLGTIMQTACVRGGLAELQSGSGTGVSGTVCAMSLGWRTRGAFLHSSSGWGSLQGHCHLLITSLCTFWNKAKRLPDNAQKGSEVAGIFVFFFSQCQRCCSFVYPLGNLLSDFIQIWQLVCKNLCCSTQ